MIAEPFFIDNDHDLDTAENNRQDLINAYVMGIQEAGKALGF